MSFNRHPMLNSLAIAGLSFFVLMQRVKADTLVCEGEFATTAECDKTSTLQGIPINQKDCSHTCDMHPGFQHTDCGTIADAAAHICGTAKAVNTHPFGGVDGNKCGYAWWSVSCQYVWHHRPALYGVRKS
jgi:hypothetical protein